MKALEKARSLLEAAELQLSAGNLARATETREIALGWLALARLQHATGAVDPAPPAPVPPQRDPRVVDAPQQRRRAP